MTDVADRPHPGVDRQRFRPRRALVALAVLVVAALGLASPTDGAPAIRTATSGCVAVGGGSAGGGGPQRATVVVDTGSGPVWSACISFSGSISGIKALELAGATIPGLSPVYDTYVGQGKAVCRLLGVGTDPPDCLGKDVKYWNYFANGAYARGGAGNTVVNDGDVQGWRFGTGAAPRPATAGTAATSAPPPTTAAPAPPPTAAPVAPGTGGGTITGSGDGGSGSTSNGSGNGSEPGQAASDPGEASDGGEPEADGEATSTTADATPDEAEAEVEVEAAEAERADGDDNEPDSEAGADESAAGVSVTDTGSPVGTSSRSAWPAAVGFAAVLAAVGAGVVVVRRRRLAAG